MANKRKTPQQWLQKAIEHHRGLRIRDLLGRKPDYSDVWGRRIAADLALTLSDRPIDASLRRAFKEFRLDPKNPFDWLDLLRTVAEIHFPIEAPRARGPKRKWDFELFDRHIEWARAKTKKILSERGELRPTHDDVASYLQFVLPEHYGRFTPATLRRYIIKRQKKG